MSEQNHLMQGPSGATSVTQHSTTKAYAIATKVFDKLEIHFGNLWKSQFQDEDFLNESLLAWAEYLQTMTNDEIKQALQKTIRFQKYPPNPSEFYMAGKGWPDEDTMVNRVLMQAYGADPVTDKVIHKIGQWNMENYSYKQITGMARAFYHDAIEDLNDGR